MAKGFSKNNPLDNLAKIKTSSSISVPSEEASPVPESKKEPETINKSNAKKKVGRPKTKDVKGTCKNINVAIPIVLLNKWEEVKIVHGSNLTEYITKLIDRDMKEHYENYKTIANSLKDI